MQSVQSTNEAVKVSSEIIIIGAGLAGLAASSILVEHGFRVTLLESRPRLGGRASSFRDPDSHEDIDNCQHVGLGCCTNWLDFCQRTGIHRELNTYDEFIYQEPSGRRSRLFRTGGPAPFHWTAGFASVKFLSWMEKFRLARGLFHLARTKNPSGPTDSWLEGHGQTDRIRSRFWEPILTSALNESLDRIDLRYARQVIVEGFLSHRDGARVLVPRRPLEELYGEGVGTWLRERGVSIRANEAVTALEYSTALNLITACQTRREVFRPTSVILAVPPKRALSLLPETLVRTPFFDRLAQFEYSPITSVHIWFDRPVMDRDHLVPLDRTTQWLFRRPVSSGDYVQAVISASRQLVPLGNPAIESMVLQEMHELLPAVNQARVIKTRVITEKSATFSVVPGIDAIRPSQQTPIRNLFLAGDYTQTGWPATMEGAVRSGYLAAESVLKYHGISRSILKPKLPTSWLSRFFFGLTNAEPDSRWPHGPIESQGRSREVLHAS
jgi:squalene-associated FAD-dependent desaturase